jgi:hypothetical protein
MGVPREGSAFQNRSVPVDDFKDVAVHRLSKEKPVKWRRPKRRKQVGTFGLEATFERVEFRQRIEQGDMPPELVFKRRHAESLDIEDVHLLTASEVEPDEFHGGVRRDRKPTISQGPFQESGRLLNFAGWQRQVRKAHVGYIVYS